MNSNASSFFNGNQHNDILNAKPASEEEKDRLVEELKRRGNAAFKSGSYPEAIVLYSKAIEHRPNEALYSNRSMTNAKMGHFKDALTDAELAIETKPGWAKGYFRKANAELGMDLHDLATQSLTKVLELEPKDSAAKKLLDSIPKMKEEYLARKERDEKRMKKQAEDEEKSKSDRIISKKIVASEESSKSSNKTTKKADDSSMRGYKVLADGRKTTFFNRELTEEDKKILGEIKHEKLEKPLEETTKLDNGASVWNKGGTFEERNFTEWGRDRLTALLKEVKCPVSLKDVDGDTDTDDITVQDIIDLEGDASIAFARGKKRHIFDFNLSVKWSVSSEGKKVSGNLFFPDISGDSVVDDDDLDFELRWTNREQAGQNVSVLANVLVDKSSKGMAGRLMTAIRKFAAEFREIV